MRALHAFLTTVCPLVILSACTERKNDSPKPPADSPPPQAGQYSSQEGQDGLRIVSWKLLTPDGRTIEVKPPPGAEAVDAVFLSANALEKILIPYYENRADEAMVKELREGLDSVRAGKAYGSHKLSTKSWVQSVP
jgi:hypothetical protein